MYRLMHPITAGAITFALGVAWWFVFPDSSATAWFLSPEERSMAVERIRANQVRISAPNYAFTMLTRIFRRLESRTRPSSPISSRRRSRTSRSGSLCSSVAWTTVSHHMFLPFEKSESLIRHLQFPTRLRTKPRRFTRSSASPHSPRRSSVSPQELLRLSQVGLSLTCEIFRDHADELPQQSAYVTWSFASAGYPIADLSVPSSESGSSEGSPTAVELSAPSSSSQTSLVPYCASRCRLATNTVSSWPFTLLDCMCSRHRESWR